MSDPTSIIGVPDSIFFNLSIPIEFYLKKTLYTSCEIFFCMVCYSKSSSKNGMFAINLPSTSLFQRCDNLNFNIKCVVGIFKSYNNKKNVFSRCDGKCACRNLHK